MIYLKNKYTLLSTIIVLSLMPSLVGASPVWTFTALSDTSVSPGNFVQYQVTNQSPKNHTLTLRSLPTGVQQVTSTGYCASPFSLTSASPSCTLLLYISSIAEAGSYQVPTVCEENASGDPNPSQCYRPSPSDRLTVTTQSNPQYAYIANRGNATVTVCPVENDGTFGSCQASSGNGTFDGPTAITTNTLGTVLYVVNNFNSTVSVCPISSEGVIGTCTASSAGGTLSAPNTIAIEPAGNYLYVSNAGTGNLTICQLDYAGAIGTCQSEIYEGNSGATFNQLGSLIYYIAGDRTYVEYCSLNADGTYNEPCSSSTASGTLVNALGISFNNSYQFLYFAVTNDSTLSVCPINSDGSLGTCFIDNGGGTFDFPVGGKTGPFMTSSTGFGYIPNGLTNTISICTIQDDGSLDSCGTDNADNTLNNPRSIVITPQNV
jgi:6-phosphogluconolactonase (cycloisomerase 2 family)